MIPDSSLVQTVLNGLLDSYQSFASTLRLMMKGNPNALSFEELVSVLLQEDQSRQNRSIMRVANQAFLVSQKGKGKWNSFASKQRFANNSQVNEKKQEQKQELFCKYCKGIDHIIKNYPKLVAKEEKKKRQDSLQKFLHQKQSLQILCRMRNGHLLLFVVSEQCMSIAQSDVWYFDSGATKHITS